MSAQEQASPGEMRSVGIGLGLAGLYGILVGFEVLPAPGGRGNLHGPLWLATLIGFVVLLAGAAAFIQGLGRANATGELPVDAPSWMRATQYLIGVALFGAFAMLGSWVAFAGDPHQFSGSISFFGGPLNVSIARIAFGIGALICWLATIGYAISGARKLLGACRSEQA